MISIILPIYNGQRFLREALDSVRSQTYSDFECICVDDGSSDDSREIIRRVSEEDSRFRLIAQANQGVAVSRNRGIEESKGDYITFLDQDDALAPDALRRMLSVAKDSGCEVVAAKINEFYGECLPANENCNSGTVSISESPFEDFFGVGKKPCVTVAVWGKLYAKKVLENIVFPAGVFGADDYVFTARLFSTIDRYAQVDERLYLYRMHPDNVTMQMPMRYIMGTLQSREIVWNEILRDLGRLGSNRKSVCRRFSKDIMSWAIKKTCRNIYTGEEMVVLRETVGRLLDEGVLNSIGWKDLFKLRLFLAGRFWLLKIFFPALFRKRV